MFSLFWMILSSSLHGWSADSLSTLDGAIIVAESGSNVIYYADSSTITPQLTTAFLYMDSAFPFYDFTDDPSLPFKLTFDTTTGTSTAATYLYVAADTSSSPIIIPIGSCDDGGSCETDSLTSKFYRMTTSTSTGFASLSLRPNEICGLYPTVNGCNGTSAIALPTSQAIAGLQLSFIRTTEAFSIGGPITDTQFSSGYRVILKPQTQPLSITCPTFPVGFTPADGAIKIDTTKITAIRDTVTGSSSKMQSVVVSAVRNNLTIPTPIQDASGSVFAKGEFSGAPRLSGFENSTQDDPKFYAGNLGVQDSSGLITFCSTNYATGADETTSLFASEIDGFLKDGNCFIATAALRKHEGFPLGLLRDFRDNVLSSSPLGRNFIHWYYFNSPRLAKKYGDNLFARLITIDLLQRLSVWLWLPTLIMGDAHAAEALPSTPAPTAITATPTVPAASPTDANLSYTEAIQKNLKAEKPESSEGYSEKIREKLTDTSTSENYSEKIRLELKEKDVVSTSNESYTEGLQKKIPQPTSTSAIEDYKKGIPLKADKGPGPNKSATSLLISGSVNKVYSAGAKQGVSYESLYGNSLSPDIRFVHEVKLKGPFYFFGSIGGSYAHGKGTLQFVPDGYSTESDAIFELYTLPLLAGGMVQTNFRNVIWPFAQLGVGPIGFLEKRSDLRRTTRGYSFGYGLNVGIRVGMDWMSARDSWNRYDTAKVRDSYITIGYSHLSTFSGGLVDLTVQGILAGFSFEF